VAERLAETLAERARATDEQLAAGPGATDESARHLPAELLGRIRGFFGLAG
jgi:hypothetical protein